jgi:hypothetical protein
MKNFKRKHFPVMWIFTLLLFVFFSCQEKEKKHKKKEKMEKQEQKNASNKEQNVTDSVDTDAQACDPNIWNYVYNPSRLEVIDKCMTATGVIQESSADDDGDQHMLLKLDAGQENLLKKKNMKEKNGFLVIEAVCMNNITNPKVGGACKGYVNHVQLPKVGDHVKVTGSYVIDSHNGWAEIHPISKIEVTK